MRTKIVRAKEKKKNVKEKKQKLLQGEHKAALKLDKYVHEYSETAKMGNTCQHFGEGGGTELNK